MKTIKSVFTFACVVLAIGVLISPAYGAPRKMQQNKGAIGVQTGASCVVGNLPYEELSEDEELGLIKMREEEKLSRDVYAALYEIWEHPVFSNISFSEQRHMNAVKVLIDKYGLIDPVTDPAAGAFTDPEFYGFYNDFVEQGSASLIDALWVGATIEDMLINDLQELLAQTDNQDLTAVYENLLRGSRNHLRAFAYLLSLNGETYEAQYITAEELEAIITSPRETGVRAEINNRFCVEGAEGPGPCFGKGGNGYGSARAFSGPGNNNNISATSADILLIDVSPNVLNLRSSGTVVTVHTNLDFNKVIVSNVLLNGVDIAWSKSDNRGFFVAKFTMDDLKGLTFNTGELNTLTLSVETSDGLTLTGSQNIKVIDIQPRGR